MTLLYIMTFGTFSGLSAQFGLLMANLYGAATPRSSRVRAPLLSSSSRDMPCRTR
jgi:nitrate/nitrite transporter NarK